MKWFNHKILSGTLIYAVTGNIGASLAGAAGSIIPDSVEGFPGPPGTLRYDRWRKKHRRLSHWYVPYLTLSVAALAYNSFYNEWNNTQLSILRPLNISGLNKNVAFGIVTLYAGYFFAGAVFHILFDALCGDVPATNPNRRVGLRLFYVGSVREYLISFILVFLFMKIRSVFY